MKKISLLILIFLLSKFQGISQEFDLDISVSTPKLNLVDPKVFKALESTLNEFVNNNQWTNDDYEPEERIEGSLSLIILDELGPTSFNAEIRIQTIRPVFNSAYKSPMLNIVDPNVTFSYTEFQPLEKSIDSYSDNLSSVITYYIYMMLASDYDSFSPSGGDQFYTYAQNTISSLPSNLSLKDDGWKYDSDQKRNRYWLLENVLNPRAKDYRYSMYDYHRNSLDNMYDDVEKSKAIMVSALSTVFDLNKAYPNSSLIQTFADTKRNEIVEIFKDANRGQQDRVYEIMTTINPAMANLYNEIRKR